MRLLSMTDGAEAGDMSFWDAYNGADVATDYIRSGDYSYKYGAYQWSTKNLPGYKTEIYIRFAVRLSTLDYSGVMNLCDIRYANVVQARVSYLPTTGYLMLYVGTGTLVAYSTVPMQLETWYLIEVHYKIHNISGVLECRVDTVPACSFAGDTQFSEDYVNFDNLHYYAGGSYATIWIDDLAANDSNWSGG